MNFCPNRGRQSKRSSPGRAKASGRLASPGRLAGGAEGNRTPDLCSAIAALSHLSYSPAARVFTCMPSACQRGKQGAETTRARLRDSPGRRIVSVRAKGQSRKVVKELE